MTLFITYNFSHTVMPFSSVLAKLAVCYYLYFFIWTILKTANSSCSNAFIFSGWPLSYVLSLNFMRAPQNGQKCFWIVVYCFHRFLLSHWPTKLLKVTSWRDNPETLKQINWWTRGSSVWPTVKLVRAWLF